MSLRRVAGVDDLHGISTISEYYTRFQCACWLNFAFISCDSRIRPMGLVPPTTPARSPDPVHLSAGISGTEANEPIARPATFEEIYSKIG
jgi:hypothetical protein